MASAVTAPDSIVAVRDRWRIQLMKMNCRSV